MEYILDGTKIVYERVYNTATGTPALTSETIYSYDSMGTPNGARVYVYNGTTATTYDFFFRTNIQGDVLAIFDGNTKAQVVSFNYDAWGNYTTTVSNATLSQIALNYTHLRYRGYYQDSETGLYYLNSRYYDAKMCRFINADGVISNANGDLQGYNLYAYCFNNLVNMSDQSGNWPKWATITLGAVAAVAAIALTVATVGAAAPAAACTLTSIGLHLGIGYTVAHGAAVGAVLVTTAATAAYAGDIAYSAVTGDSLLLNTLFNGDTEAYNAGLAVVSVATAGMLNLAAQSPGVCFVEGTLVLTEQGKTRIEEIVTGDYVWATNTDTGETALKRVVRTFKNEAMELIHISINGETITCTNEHPFYSPVKGWTAACKLRAGDMLITLNGEYVIVEWVQHEILESPIIVYNFEVEDFHTYYVGNNDGILVHNTCKNPTSPNQMQKQVERGQAPDTVVRVDNPKIPGQLPHIHFSDGKAMNIDGSVHDKMKGAHTLTNSEKIWIFENGWGG